MALYQIEKNAQGVPTGDYKTVAGGTLWADAPIGVIYAYGGNDIPTGWKYCDGQEVSKTEYAELYSVIGDSFKGNKTPASGNFCLPDLRECTLKGASDTNNNTYTIGTHQKIAVGEFLDDRVKNITLKSGDVQIYSGAGHDRGLVAGGSADRTLSNYSTSTTGATTEVKSVGVNYIIKAKMVAMPSDFMSKVDEAVEDVYGDIIPSDTSADNKLVNSDTVDTKLNDIWKVQGEFGAKNLIPYPYLMTTKTANGVTFTDNGDGTITVNGTAESALWFNLCKIDFGDIPIGTRDSKYQLSNGIGYSLVGIDVGYNAKNKITSINISQGASLDNVTVRPMIRYKSDTDRTWQPYAPTNYQLKQKLDTIAGIYLPNATNTNSKKVVASVGQTSVTFDANSFMTRYNVTASDLDLDISAETASGDVVAYNNVSVTGGIVTVTFDALAEQTTFICKCSVIQ